MLPTEKQIIERIESIDFYPLKVKKISRKSLLLNKEEINPYQVGRGSYITLEWQGEKEDFVVEVKRIFTPKEVENTLLQIKNYSVSKKNLENKEYRPLIVTPYLRLTTISRLVEEGVSGIDLCGNAIIQIPGKWFIEKIGYSNNYPDNVPIKNVFKGNTSVVGRMFLSKPLYKKVSDIEGEIVKCGGQITLGTVSKALKVMENELIISRKDNIKLLDAGKLLELLEKNYPGIKVNKSIKGKISSIDEFLQQGINKEEKKEIKIVGSNVNLYAVMPASNAVTTIYTTSIEKLIRNSDFRETDKFANIEIHETEEPMVYFDRKKRNNFLWAPPLQIYLELANGGKRERETAEQIKKNLLNFGYLE